MRYAIWLAALTLALSGCRSGGMKSGGDESMAGSCDRTITVQVIGGKVDLDPVHACIKNKNTKVTWEFVDFQKGKYVFHPDSVTVLGDTYNDFPDCNTRCTPHGDVEDARNKLKCTDVNSQPGQYDYVMTVYFPNGGEAARSDPTIVNN